MNRATEFVPYVDAEKKARQEERFDDREDADQFNGAGGDHRAEEDTYDAGAPLKFIDLARWDTEPIPDQEWTVPDRFPRHDVALLSGEGGTGKTILLQHLAVAHVLGRDWLRSVPERGPVIYVNCEDREPVILRRLKPVLDHYGLKFADIAKDLHIVSLAGKDAILALPDHNGRMITTPRFARLREQAMDIKPVNIFLDNAADIFGGNENDRAQVRQFITIIRGLAIDAECGVIVSSHPSLTGLATKTGLSGNTAWHNSVRARAWLKYRTMMDEVEIDSDTRELEFMKNQHGPKSEAVPLRWQNGVYVPEPRPGSLDQMASDKKADDVFLMLLTRFNEQGQNVSHKKCSTYAPKVFSDHPEAKGTSSKIFASAMQRLIDGKQVLIEKGGSPSKPRDFLIVGGQT